MPIPFRRRSVIFIPPTPGVPDEPYVRLRKDAKCFVYGMVACRIWQFLFLVAQSSIVFYVVMNPGWWMDLQLVQGMGLVTFVAGITLIFLHFIRCSPNKGNIWMLVYPEYYCPVPHLILHYSIYMILDFLMVAGNITLFSASYLDYGKDFRKAFEPPPFHLWEVERGLFFFSIVLWAISIYILKVQRELMKEYLDRRASEGIALEVFPPAIRYDELERPSSSRIGVHPAHPV